MNMVNTFLGTFMKTEKEILAEFTALVFGQDEQSEFDYLSKDNLLKGSLSAVRLAANDAIEISSLMRKEVQTELNSKMLSIGLPSLNSMQNKVFRDFMKVANRGNIKNDQEYRLVRSVSETNLLNNELQSLAYSLLEIYEQARA